MNDFISIEEIWPENKNQKISKIQILSLIIRRTNAP